MILDKKHCQKIKYFNNMSNSIILGGHYENKVIKTSFLSLPTLIFGIQHTKLPQNKMSSHFLHKMH